MLLGQPASSPLGSTALAAAPALLRLEWSSADGAALLAEAMLALFGPVSDEMELETPRGLRDAADVEEALRLLRSDASSIRFLGDDWSLRLRLAEGAIDFGVETIELCDASAEPSWLQAHPLPRCPVATLATRLPEGAVPEELLHALVGLAHRLSPLRSARFGAVTWSPGGVGEVVLCDGPRWSRVIGSDSGLRASGLAPLQPPDPSLVDQLADAAASGADAEALTEILARHAPCTVEVRAQASTTPFHLPPPADATLRLVPAADRVIIEVELTLPPRDLALTLAHATAHLRLGHVRPRDAFGHWDTTESIASSPWRRWDREVREQVPEWAPPAIPKRGSLQECTPLEKSWLVLLHHIGQMVGEARSIHPRAAGYQAAAYQRQAAQRLVAQLEEHGGAMLCDGVGLGKTYVATTVVVHYANWWLDKLANEGRRATQDPFRVTILAPNSVVSTWRREALPGLAAFGVPLATVRVVSHTSLSRILGSSAILDRERGEISDFEHLLLSDLVIVDEAHNFRSIAARRTAALRDILRLQPRKDQRRRVLLLTATPVNNSLDDLRQEVSLLFARPLWFNTNTTPEGYRGKVPKDIEERIAKARRQSGDVSAVLIHNSADAKFSTAIEFRDDLNLGVQVQRVGDYLKEQEKRLAVQQVTTRAAMRSGQAPAAEPVRVAAELLDRIVVQRSRALCKQIEREQGSDVELLFRPEAPKPEKLVYADEYDGTHDVLAGFLPLFATGAEAETAETPPLSLKVYMWADVRDGIQPADATSSVVGLQRVLVLKRLESSPVSFLITLLRLLALHAHRLKQLSDLCHDLGDRARGDELDEELLAALADVDDTALERLDLLVSGSVSHTRGRDLLNRWSRAHRAARPTSGDEDVPPTQLTIFARAADDEETASKREQLDLLWGLEDDLVQDFATLLHAAPGLAEVVFGRFDREDWPRRFIAGGQDADWPTSATWGLRIAHDAKIRLLVARLLRARADQQKVVVFSQFTDTLAYVQSVMEATSAFDAFNWQMALDLLSQDAGRRVTEDDVRDLVERTRTVSGETEDRESVIDGFAPFYRIGPRGPDIAAMPNEEGASLLNAWQLAWTRALREPVDVVLASDVLAEGVNLQDAALLINYDVHWNPVRMIQRAGRIDRRLNPAVENATSFPELEVLAAQLDVPTPRYWWHGRREAAPVTVNLLLSDELEKELQLRESIANKTLTIDFTLGLERGTGAEADWMADYRYQGISALNAWQRDRAIEQVAGYQERLRRVLSERTIDPAWVDAWNGWLRERGAPDDSPLVGWASLGLVGGSVSPYTRYLTPTMQDEIPHWLWTTAKPADTLLNFWLRLDGLTKAAPTRTGLPWSEDASRPVAAEDLLGAARQLVDAEPRIEELGKEVGRPLTQGASAISAGFLGHEADRKALRVAGFRLLQLRSFRSAPAGPTARRARRGLSRPCSVCGAPASMHKCCPSCGATASGEAAVEATFGFRQQRAVDGTASDVPQTWCRACRPNRATDPDPTEAPC